MLRSLRSIPIEEGAEQVELKRGQKQETSAHAQALSWWLRTLFFFFS